MKKDREEALSPKTKVKNWLVTSKPVSPVSTEEMSDKNSIQTNSKQSVNPNLLTNQQKVKRNPISKRYYKSKVIFYTFSFRLLKRQIMTYIKFQIQILLK